MPRQRRRRKRIFILVGLIVLTAAAGLTAMQIRNARQASLVVKNRASGMAAHEAGNHVQAINDLGYVFNKSPEDGEVALVFAQSRREVESVNSRHLAEAVMAAKRAAKLMPEDLRPRILLMSLYGQMGRLTERLDASHAVLELEPKNLDALWVEIDSLRRMGRRQEALQRAKDLHESYPDDPRATQTVVEIMVAMQQPEDEVRTFIGQAVADNPDDVTTLLLKARVLGLYQRTDEARQVVLQAAKMDQPDARTLAATIQLLDLLGEEEMVDSLLERERGATGHGDMASLVAASRAWKNAETNKAITLITEGMGDPAAASDSFLGWSAYIDAQGEVGLAARNELTSRQSDEARAWVAVLEARDSILAGDWTQAKGHLQRSNELNRNSEIVSFLDGEIARAVGDWRAAINSWAQLRLREPRWLTLRVDLVALDLAVGKVKEAYNEALLTLRAWPDRMVAAVTAGRAGAALIEAGQATDIQKQQIIGILKEVVAQADDPSVGISLLVRAQAGSDDLAAARTNLTRLLDGDSLPKGADLVGLIESCRRFGVFGVDELVERSATQSGDQPDVLIAAALAAHGQGRTRQGEAIINGAIDRAADDPTRLAALKRIRAVYLDRVGDAGALDALKEIAQTEQNRPEAQLAILNSKAAWTDQPAIRSAITALRNLSGEGGSMWRIFEARRLLIFEAGDRAAAEIVTLLNPVVVREPDNAPALTLLGEAYATLKDFKLSTEMLSRALDNDPNNASLFVELISILQASGQTDQAEISLRLFLQIDPLPDTLRRRRAQLLLAQGMNEQAIPDLDALAQGGSIEEQILAARATARTGDDRAAKTRFDAILRRTDRTTGAVVSAADFYARSVSFEEGVAILGGLPEEVGQDDRTLIRAAFLRRHGHIEEAEKEFETAATRSNSVEAWVGLARLRLKNGDSAGAREAVVSGLQSHPDDAELKKLDLATAEAGTAVPIEALAAISELLGKDNAAKEPLDKFIDAIKAIQTRPDDTRYAIDQLRPVAEEYPTFFPVWNALAKAYSIAGDPSQAAAVARQAAYSNPTNADAAKLAANALMLAGQYDEAFLMTRQWSQRLEDDPYPAQIFGALLLHKLGRDDEALEQMKPWSDRIVYEAPSAANVLEVFAGLLAQAGERDAAAQLYEPLIAENPAWAISRVRLALKMISQPVPAREWIERWGPMLPDTPAAKLALGETWYNLATFTNDHETLQRAMNVLEPLVTVPDVQFGAAMMLGGAYEQLDDFDLAEQNYRLALKSRPDTPVTLNNLAFLIYRMDGSITEAIELSQRAVKLASQAEGESTRVANFLDTLGAVLLKAGRFDESADAYGRAAAITPGAVGVQLGLVEAQLGAGKILEARRTINTLVGLRDRGQLSDSAQRDRLAEFIERADAGQPD